MVAQGGGGIAAGGGAGGEQLHPGDGVEPGHLILLVKPLPGRLGVELNHVDLSGVVEGAAAHGVIQHRSPFFRGVLNGTDERNIIEKGGFLVHDEGAQRSCARAHHVGVDIDLGDEAQQDPLEEIAVRDAAVGGHKGVGELAQIQEECAVAEGGGEGVHIVQHPPVEALHIFLAPGDVVWILLEVLAVKGGQGDHAVHAVIGVVGRIGGVQQALRFG